VREGASRSESESASEASKPKTRGHRSDAWKECNKRFLIIIERLAPQLPESFAEMEPLFLAVICGCNAGLFREALPR
jgi:hypothetical protein